MGTLKNRELTNLIGRRLKEALSDEGNGLPDAISDCLEALRRAEGNAAAASQGLVVDIGDGEDEATPPKRDSGDGGARDAGPREQ